MPPFGAGGSDESLRLFIGLDSNVAASLKRIESRLDGFSTGVDRKIGRSIRTFGLLGTTIRGVGNRLAAFTRRYTALATTLASTAVIFKSVSDAQKFGIAIAEIGTIFDGTAEDLAKVEARVLSLSEALGLSETIAAKGFYQIISSDITDAADALLILEEGAKLSTVGLADTAATIDVLTSVIKAYQRPVEDAADISNALFKAVIKGKLTISELSTSLGQVLPVAATLGIELEEVLASVATVTQGGIELNTSVIQLRQAMNSLLKPSVEATATLAKYGVNVSIASIKNEGFVATLAKLEKELKGNAGALSRIFGNIRGLLPILSLTGKQADQFRKNIAFISSDVDKVNEALERFLLTPFKRFSVFFNALRVRLRGVGEAFIKEFARVLDEQGGIPAIVNKIDALFGALRGIAGAAAEGFGRLIGLIDNTIQRFGGLERASSVFTKGGELFGAGIDVIAQQILALNSTLVQLVVQLPKFLATFVNELRVIANKFIPDLFPGVEKFEILPTEDEIRRELGGKLRLVEELRRRAAAAFERDKASGVKFAEGLFPEDAVVQAAGKLFRRIRTESGKIADLEIPLPSFSGVVSELERGVLSGVNRETLARIFGNKASFAEIAQSIELVEEVIGRLTQQAELAPVSFDKIGGSASIIADNYGPGSEAAQAADNFFDKWSALREELEKPIDAADPLPPKVFEAIEGLGKPFSGGGFLSLLIRPELSDEARIGLIATIEELKSLAESAGIKVPVELDATDRENSIFRVIKPDLERLVRFLDESGKLFTQVLPDGQVLEEFALDAEGVAGIFGRQVELATLLEEQLRQLPDREREVADILRRTSGLRRAQLEEVLDLNQATAETREILGSLFGEIEQQNIADLVGFKDFESEFLQASKGLTDTIDKQRAALERNNAEFRKRFELLRDLGLIETDQQFLELLDVLSEAEKQLAEKTRESILSQEAFAPIGAAELLFERLELQAKETAREVTNIEKAANQAEFEKLRKAFNDAMDDLTRKGDSFVDGFLAGLADISRTIGDDVANGIQTATEAVETLRSSFSEGLSLVIQGELPSEEIIDQFRRSLATGLADTVSNAITDALFGTVADAIKKVFAESTAEAFAKGIKLPEDFDFTPKARQDLPGVDGLDSVVISARAVDTEFVSLTTKMQAFGSAVTAATPVAPTAAVPVTPGGPAIPTGDVTNVTLEANTKLLDQAFVQLAAASSGLKLSFDQTALSSNALSAALSKITTALANLAISVSVFKKSLEADATGDAVGGAVGAASGGSTAESRFGGFVPRAASNFVQSFAAGGFPQRVERLTPGIKTHETFSRVSEGAIPELVVPLPGNRKVPVEVMGGRGGRGALGGNRMPPVTVNSSVTVVVEGSGNAERDVRGQSRTIERVIETALVNGTNRGLKVAVRRAANGV